jgi:hypothetical protein
MISADDDNNYCPVCSWMEGLQTMSLAESAYDLQGADISDYHNRVLVCTCVPC